MEHPPPPSFLLIRATLPALSSKSTLCRFSGGIHAFLCMARALGGRNESSSSNSEASSSSPPPRVLSSAPRGALLRDAVEQGYLLLPGGAPSPSPYTPGVVRVEVEGVKHHVSLTDFEETPTDVEARAARLTGASAAAVIARLPPAQAALMLEAMELARRTPSDRPLVVILNADGAQGPLGGGGGAAAAETATTATATTPTPTTTVTLTEAVAAVFGERALALVQNVHSLPFGPYGGAARGSEALQTAWGLGGGGGVGNGGSLPRLGGAIAVSRFVRDYLGAHCGIVRERLIHVPLSAWGVFGDGPWPDFGGELAAAAAASAAASAAAAAPPPQQPPPPPFVVACPKLTPEKGLGLVVQLARRLPDVSFVGVGAGAEAAAAAAEEEEAAALPPNLRLLPPSPSPDAALRGAALCLCPSLWREAYGMAAVDAALRGIPVAASRGCGGLTEAVLLKLDGGGDGGGGGGDDGDGDDDDDPSEATTWPARLLPVEFVRVPNGDHDGGNGGGGSDTAPPPSPPWARREVPREQSRAVVAAWAATVEGARDEFLSRPSEFARRSAATRQRALEMVGRGSGELRAFLGAVGG